MPTDFDGLVILIMAILAWLSCSGIFLLAQKQSGADLDNKYKVPVTTLVLVVWTAVGYLILYLVEGKPFDSGAFMLLLGAITAAQQGIFQYTKNVLNLSAGSNPPTGAAPPASS